MTLLLDCTQIKTCLRNPHNILLGRTKYFSKLSLFKCLYVTLVNEKERELGN